MTELLSTKQLLLLLFYIYYLSIFVLCSISAFCNTHYPLLIPSILFISLIYKSITYYLSIVFRLISVIPSLYIFIIYLLLISAITPTRLCPAPSAIFLSDWKDLNMIPFKKYNKEKKSARPTVFEAFIDFAQSKDKIQLISIDIKSIFNIHWISHVTHVKKK